MTVLELINDLATKAGYDTNTEGYKALLSSTSLNVAVPDDVADAIQSNLFTIDSAKTQRDLKNHFFKQAYDGLDKELARTMDKLAISDDLKTRILAEPSSVKRASLIAEGIQEAKSNMAATNNKGEKDEYLATINALKAEKAELLAAKEQEIQSITAAKENELVGLLLENSLNSFKLGMGDIPAEFKVISAKSALDKALKEKGLQYVRDGNSLKLQSLDGTDYFEKNGKVDFKGFAESVLAANKLLQTSEPAVQAAATNTTVSGSTPYRHNAAISSLNEEMALAMGK